MKCAIMQPYFFPYLGYWQLINNVDVFVIYDNIEYSKAGWINRNRYLLNGDAVYMTVPLVKSSDYLDIIDKRIADSFWHKKIYNQIRIAYSKAPYLGEVLSIIDEMFNYRENNLFWFLKNTIDMIVDRLRIKTKIVVSSEISRDRTKKGQDRVIDLCKELNADIYVNPIGGIELYKKERFESEGIKLVFLKPIIREYKQFNNCFVPSLSIIDIIAFNGIDNSVKMLSDFDLI